MNDRQTTSPPHRLHNSGSRPQEVFRCPAIGRDGELDLVRALAWSPDTESAAPTLPAALDRIDVQPYCDLLRSAGQYRVTPRIELPVIADLTRALLERMQEPLSDEADDASALLDRLVRRVVSLGWHRDRVGLAQSASLPPMAWRDRERCGTLPVRVQEAAVTLACFAVFAPPLLLWWRPATLDWLRWDVQLRVRWFRPQGGGR